MQTCELLPKPTPLSYEKIKHLRIGQSANVENSCGPRIVPELCPNNGEFVAIHNKKCQGNHDYYGRAIRCGSGSGSPQDFLDNVYDGRSTSCERVSYEALPKSCCEGKSTYGKTCDPKYTPGSFECIAVLNDSTKTIDFSNKITILVFVIIMLVALLFIHLSTNIISKLFV